MRARTLVLLPRCIACGRATDPRRSLCLGCTAALAHARPGRSLIPVAGSGPLCVDWACEYRGASRDLVRALKFGRRIPAAEAMAEQILPLLGDAVAIVPVPASPLRRRWRGFDPAEEIALALGRLTGREVRKCLRRKNGTRQVGRSRAARLADPPRVRAVGPPPMAAVLVDDVFTTGATLTACAQALGGSAAGAVVFARTL